uniref:Opsin n=1 Tax=Ditylenchus dipsaci TaxID=166011 RepID=A0A915DAV0_9BILA
MESPCYKIMYYIGINDMLCMCVNTFLTGYFAITGAVFCTHPTFIYIAGNFGLGCWASETVAEVTLALNRCIAICSPKWEYILFRGYKTWLWMMIPTLYAFYWATFTKPILFSGIYMSWFFNPHVGYYDDFGSCMIMSQHNYSQKMIFLQVVMISMINAVAAAIYVVMQFVRISQTLIYLGSITWVLAHGIPPVIYLAMNKTLRRDAIKMCINLLQHGDHEIHSNNPTQHPNGTKNNNNGKTNAWSNNSTIGLEFITEVCRQNSNEKC